MQICKPSAATSFAAAIAIAFVLLSGAKASENGATSVAAASQAWDAAFNAGDVDRLMGRYTSDAVSMPPGRPALVGRDAIAADFRAFFDGHSARHETLEPVRDVMTDTAIERAEYTMEIHPDGGEPISEEGKHIVVYSRGDDGIWRVKWEIWNAGR
jgi:uncharacterized protein (TIGR02246 family)